MSDSFTSEDDFAMCMKKKGKQRFENEMCFRQTRILMDEDHRVHSGYEIIRDRHFQMQVPNVLYKLYDF